MSQRKIRVLVSKLGLDGHDRGAKLVAHTLKKAGMDVVYLGIRHTVEEVVDTAVREDVDYIGLSFLSGDHMTLVPKLMHELEARDARDIRIIVGGIILRDDVPGLIAMGVREVFLPGTPLDEIANYIREDSALLTA